MAVLVSDFTFWYWRRNADGGDEVEEAFVIAAGAHHAGGETEELGVGVHDSDGLQESLGGTVAHDDGGLLVFVNGEAFEGVLGTLGAVDLAGLRLGLVGRDDEEAAGVLGVHVGSRGTHGE